METTAPQDGSPRPSVAPKWRFIHVPKTGGEAFAKAYGRGVHHPNNHAKACSFDDSVRLFAIFRNPIDRAVSAAAYDLRGRLSKDNLLTPATLEFWLRNNDCWDWKAPQITWLDRRVTLLSYTRLRDDLRRYLPTIGVEYRTMPRTNVGHRHRGLERYLTPAVWELIQEQYADDLRVYYRLLSQRTPCLAPL